MFRPLSPPLLLLVGPLKNIFFSVSPEDRHDAVLAKYRSKESGEVFDPNYINDFGYFSHFIHIYIYIYLSSFRIFNHFANKVQKIKGPNFLRHPSLIYFLWYNVSSHQVWELYHFLHQIDIFFVSCSHY